MKLLYEQRRGFRFSKGADKLDFAPHIHSAVEIVFLTAGSSEALYGRERISLASGDVFIVFPNQIHGYENSRDVEGYILILPAKSYLSAYYNTLMNQIPVYPCLKAGQWEERELLTLLELAYNDLNTASPAVIQGYLQVIVGKLLSQLTLQDTAGVSDDAIRAVLDFLHAHYSQPLTRREIAKAVGYNESYISHLFSETLQTTIPDYVNSLRVYDASRLLVETDLPVARIAAELGFGSIRNFNRVFLKNTGTSPKAYRTGIRR
jgi:AraC-like DNA-binding protein